VGQGWLEAGAGVGLAVTPGDELVGQAPGLVAGPGLEGDHELALVDDPRLQREQSEEQMTVSSGDHGEAPIVGVDRAQGPISGGGPGIESSGLDYRKSALHLHPYGRASWDGCDGSAVGASIDLHAV
jgi:hypothetical protein